MGRFTIGLLSVHTGDLDPLDAQSPGIEPATFTVARAKRDILRRSSIGAMVTHRTATPGRAGSNLGYGLDATFSFYQNVRVDTYVAGTQTDGRRGDDLSYRGLFDYNADRYGFTAERLVVEPNFLPEIGFRSRSALREWKSRLASHSNRPCRSTFSICLKRPSPQPSCALARRTPLRHACLSVPSLSTTRRRKRRAAICA
jgi:hypothetical protein